MSTEATTTLYTAVVAVSGGRAGRAVSESGSLDLELARPAQRGTGGGTDPEELFAAGYAACFDSALAVAARRRSASLGPSTTTGAVSLLTTEDHQYSVSVTLTISAPDCDQDLLEVIGGAHLAQGLVQLWFDWRPADAARSFERALALNASSAAAHQTCMISASFASSRLSIELIVSSVSFWMRSACLR